jgi:phage terminase small subunit
MKLTEKQKRFCDEYLIDLNGTQAAIRAGFSKKTADVQAVRLLGNVKVQEYLKIRQQKVADKFEIKQERVLRELASIAFSDIRKYYSEDGGLKAIKDLDDESAAALAGMEVDELWGTELDEDGGFRKVQQGVTKKIKRWDKVKAVEVINKMLGFNAPEKREHEFGDNFLDFLKKTSG